MDEMDLVVHDLGVTAYGTALAMQEELVARKIAGDHQDYLLLLEHPPVYTLGRGADSQDLCGAGDILAVPVFRISRGGGATFHGPGQLVAYPIITLDHGGRDVHRYVRRLEDVLIAVCADFEIAAQRRVGFPGVWVGDAKIAAIGIGVRRWTTFHGIALNVSTEMQFFARIVSCRMPDVRMTSMALERGSPPPMSEVGARFARYFQTTFGYAEPAALAACRA
jgi:lipoate-protein ligase B